MLFTVLSLGNNQSIKDKSFFFLLLILICQLGNYWLEKQKVLLFYFFEHLNNEKNVGKEISSQNSMMLFPEQENEDQGYVSNAFCSHISPRAKNEKKIVAKKPCKMDQNSGSFLLAFCELKLEHQSLHLQ